MNYLRYLQGLPPSPKSISTRKQWEEHYPGIQDPVLCGATGPFRTGSYSLSSPKLPTNHVQGCSDCLRLLRQLDPKAFSSIVMSGASHSIPRKACVEMLPFVDGGVVIGINTADLLAPKTSDLTIRDRDNVDHQLISILPSLEVGKMRIAPMHPGIYFVTSHIEGNQSILYVGKAQNIRERWKSHHRLPELELLTSVGVNIQVHFLIIPHPIGSDKNLTELESHYIDALSPKLNRKPVTKIEQGLSCK